MPVRRPRWARLILMVLSPLILGVLGLPGCNNGGDNGSPRQVSTPSLESKRQLAQELLRLYRTAILQEDMDRLQALLDLPPTAQGVTACPATVEPTLTAQALFATMRCMFVQGTVLALEQQSVEIAADASTVTMLEVLSLEDATQQEQRTHLLRTTWHLAEHSDKTGITVQIRAAQRQLLAVATMSGQVQAGVLARLTVTLMPQASPLTDVHFLLPDATAVPVVKQTGRFHGIVRPLAAAALAFVEVHLTAPQRAPLIFRHTYRLQQPHAGVMQRLELGSGPSAERFSAVAVAQDGTVWFGGEARHPQAIGTLVQVAADGRVVQTVQPTNALIPVGLPEVVSHIEDIVVDRLGRLHSIFLTRQFTGAAEQVKANGVVVFDPQYPATFCQTVNVFNQQGEAHPGYPLLVRDIQSGAVRPSASTRGFAVAGADGDIWLAGSDGGVARVADTFRHGQCQAVSVRYHPVYQRPDLLANTVPAIVDNGDGTWWFGTVLGVSHFRDGAFSSLFFPADVEISRSATTLEAFFRQVAAAIIAAQPLTTVQIGDVSFLETLGQPVSKDHLIFSAAADRHARLWVSTLGGGLRRFADTTQELRLTHLDGLPSNIGFALAVDADNALWVATEAGLSQVVEQAGSVRITNFTALDGITPPVRDVAVDRTNTVWLATDRGIFRRLSGGGQITGAVLDPAGQPIAGVDVIVQGTPWRTVTDTMGHFVLPNVPPGSYLVHITGQEALQGPFTAVLRAVEVTSAIHTLATVTLMRPNVPPPLLIKVGGDQQTGVVGQPAPRPLTVQLSYPSGQPAAQIPVHFRALGAQPGRLSVTQTSTDQQGQATTLLTLSPVFGSNRIEARIAGLEPVFFTIIGLADTDTARLVVVSGNNQMAQPGQELPLPLVVRLQDQFQNPVSAVEVQANLLQGAAAFPAGNRTLTDLQGLAQFRLLVTTNASGILIVEVSAPGTAPVQFKIVVDDLGTSTRRGGGIAVGPTGLVFAVHTSQEAVLQIDLNNAAQLVVSGCLIPPPAAQACPQDVLVGDGEAFVNPIAIAVENAESLVVVDSSSVMKIVRVNIASGQRQTVATTSNLNPCFQSLRAIAVEPTGHLLVLDDVQQALLRLAADGSACQEVSGPNVGGGNTPLRFPQGLTVRPPFIGQSRHTLWVAAARTIMQVQAKTGKRTALSRGFDRLRGIAVDPTHIFVVDDFLKAVFHISEEPGGVDQVISGCRETRPSGVCKTIVGQGPGFGIPEALAVLDTQSLVVWDSQLQRVLKVDRRTGERALLP